MKYFFIWRIVFAVEIAKVTQCVYRLAGGVSLSSVPFSFFLFLRKCTLLLVDFTGRSGSIYETGFGPVCMCQIFFQTSWMG